MLIMFGQYSAHPQAVSREHISVARGKHSVVPCLMSHRPAPQQWRGVKASSAGIIILSDNIWTTRACIKTKCFGHQFNNSSADSCAFVGRVSGTCFRVAVEIGWPIRGEIRQLYQWYVFTFASISG